MGHNPTNNVPDDRPEGESKGQSNSGCYRPRESVEGRTAGDWLKFGLLLPFSARSPLARQADLKDAAESPTPAAEIEQSFELLRHSRCSYYCFNDSSIRPAHTSLAESSRSYDIFIDHLEKAQQELHVRPLWIRADLSQDPVYAKGGAVSPNADDFIRVANHVKQVIDSCLRLRSENVVISAGCEGYEQLSYASTERDLDQLARFMKMARDYASDIGYEGQFLIAGGSQISRHNPYDFSPADWMNFIRQFGLLDQLRLKLSISRDTSTWPKLLQQLRFARIQYCLGSVDVHCDVRHQNDLPTSTDYVHLATRIMLQVLRQDGFANGGVTICPTGLSPDVSIASHVTRITDCFARGLQIASRLRSSGELEELISRRFSSFQSDIGKAILMGRADFRQLEEYALTQTNNHQHHHQKEEAIDDLIERHM